MFASVTSDIRHIAFEGISARRSVSPYRLAGPYRSSVLNDPATPPVDVLSSWLLQHAGLNPAAYRPVSLLRRVPACLRHLRVGDSEAALRLLQRDPSRAPAVLNTLLIGVSAFFRNPEVFSELEHRILPPLLAARGGGIRVVSLGVSTGQELYSVAMLLHTLGGLEASELLGLDCRPEALERARLGVYTNEELEGLSLSHRERFLVFSQSEARVCTELRSRVTWQLGNALSFNEHAQSDLILFRNVAIYLERSHADRTWVRLTEQLRPGGILVTGKAETPPPALGYERVASCLFRKPRA